MEEELKNLAFLLKELIEKDPRVQNLEISEKKLSSNSLVAALSKQIKQIEIEYADAQKASSFGHYSLLPIQEKLFLAKQKLDLEPQVVVYKKNYQSVRLLYEHINQEIFEVFNQHVCEVHK